jgi:hypothetical protein
VQLQVGQVGQPDEGGEVVGDDEVDPAVAGLQRHRAHPVRRVRGPLLLVEVSAVHAVGITLERQRAAAQVRQQRRRHARVVLDDLALGEADLGIEDLVEVRQRQLLAVDLDLLALAGRHEWARYPLPLSG